MSKRVLFVHPWFSTFVRQDERILAAHYDLEILHFVHGPGFYTRLWKLISHRQVDLVYQWFMVPEYSALTLFLCKTYKIPFVLVTGGTDVACIPELRFGNMRKPHFRALGSWVLRNSDLILPFSEFSAGEVRRWATPRGRMVTLFPGVDTEFFTGGTPARERTGVITVASVDPLFNVQKGLLGFSRVSREFPDVPFRIVGRIFDPKSADRLREMGGPNLELVGRWLSEEDLREEYRQASVYAQLSAHEGFGIAVAESMSCGCVPVVSSGTATPEVIGEYGQAVPFGDIPAASRAIRAALETGDSEREAGRRRIAENFSEARRTAELPGLLDSVLRPN